MIITITSKLYISSFFQPSLHRTEISLAATMFLISTGTQSNTVAIIQNIGPGAYYSIRLAQVKLGGCQVGIGRV